METGPGYPDSLVSKVNEQDNFDQFYQKGVQSASKSLEGKSLKDIIRRASADKDSKE